MVISGKINAGWVSGRAEKSRDVGGGKDEEAFGGTHTDAGD